MKYYQILLPSLLCVVLEITRSYCCRLLQAKEPSGVYCETDGFLRQCLREYKNAKRCPVAIQMIQTLSSIPIVSPHYELFIALPNLPNMVKILNNRITDME